MRQRAVLVVLLLSANRVVAVDRLVDELWPDEPPAQAVNALQTYISNLRRALEPARAPREPARVLRSEPPGYLLVVEPNGSDAARFEHLASEGRRLLRERQPRDARDRLVEALSLWRGPALAEFAAEGFARTDAARLEELRAMTLEDRIAAELELGEHAAVVGELQRLVDEQPLREQLWAQLILALYRCGRQGEALAAYRRCRQTLDAELGIEPNPALRQLEADVLQQASSLEWRPAPPPSAGRARIGAPVSLVYRDATDRLHVYPLEREGSRITVGRESSADVWLSWDVRVSRLHAELECRDGEWAVIDDGTSRNGSYVNDERVRGRHVLSDGDELRFGDTVMTFRSPLHSAAVETSLADRS